MPVGFTSYILSLFQKFNLDNNIKYIVISKKLKQDLKLINALVLDDAVNTEDFKNLGLTKYLYEFVYVGSLFDGKGIEIIDYLSKNFYEKIFIYLVM